MDPAKKRGNPKTEERLQQLAAIYLSEPSNNARPRTKPRPDFKTSGQSLNGGNSGSQSRPLSSNSAASPRKRNVAPELNNDRPLSATSASYHPVKKLPHDRPATSVPRAFVEPKPTAAVGNAIASAWPDQMTM